MPLHQPPRPARSLTWLKDLLVRHGELPADRQRATELIRAVDAGGLPLNPAIVNDIARRLGLDVAGSAPVEQTIERIRQLLQTR